jgi:hypothetical protein
VSLASDALHVRARAFVRAFEAGARMPEPFDVMACDLARFQAASVPGYARLCRARGVDAATLARAGDAPAVPADAFKVARVAAFSEAEACAVFRTSGTTGGARGAHAMRTVATYDAAAVAFGRWALARGLSEDAQVLVLGPSDAEAGDSSLAHMCGLFARTFGRGAFFLRGATLDVEALRACVRSLDGAALVLGASFAFVHLLDALGAERLPLPEGSRAMQTGGFKGRSREVDGAELRAAIADAFAISTRAVVGEYGMTELSSQFYEATVADAGGRAGVFVEPPWARVVPVHPETLREVPRGEVGIARIEDLMNVDSAFAVLAADRVRRVEGGFELLGRAPGAPPRGCSIAVDEILGGGA